MPEGQRLNPSGLVRFFRTVKIQENRPRGLFLLPALQMPRRGSKVDREGTGRLCPKAQAAGLFRLRNNSSFLFLRPCCIMQSEGYDGKQTL